MKTVFKHKETNTSTIRLQLRRERMRAEKGMCVEMISSGMFNDIKFTTNKNPIGGYIYRNITHILTMPSEGCKKMGGIPVFLYFGIDFNILKE